MKRVLVVLEPGRAGATALDLACRIAEAETAAVSVVGVAPYGMSGSRCGNSALDYNASIEDAVAADVDRACAELRQAGVDAWGQILIDADGDEVTAFAAAGEFDLILLPARRRLLRATGHPLAQRLRDAVSADVRVVESASGGERVALGADVSGDPARP